MTAPHKATPEQWQELRDTIAALERRVGEMEWTTTFWADVAEAFERAGQRLAAPPGEAPAPAAESAAADRLDGIARKLMSEAAGYVSDAQLVGNVTAEDIVDLCNAFLDRQSQAAPATAPAAAPADDDAEDMTLHTAAIITRCNWLRVRGFHDAAEALDGGKGVGMEREAGR